MTCKVAKKRTGKYKWIETKTNLSLQIFYEEEQQIPGKDQNEISSVWPKPDTPYSSVPQTFIVVKTHQWATSLTFSLITMNTNTVDYFESVPLTLSCRINTQISINLQLKIVPNKWSKGALFWKLNFVFVNCFYWFIHSAGTNRLNVECHRQGRM